MLDVTVPRLRERWPSTRIGVMTSASLLLFAFQPEAEPILDVGRAGGLEVDWSGAHRPSSDLGCVVGDSCLVECPAPPSIPCATHPNSLCKRLKKISPSLLGRPERSTESDFAERSVPLAVRDASLVLAMGGGYLADVDPGQTRRTLGLPEWADDADIGRPRRATGRVRVTGDDAIELAAGV